MAEKITGTMNENVEEALDAAYENGYMLVAIRTDGSILTAVHNPKNYEILAALTGGTREAIAEILERDD